MTKIRVLLTIFLFSLIVVASRESLAVIYKYMNEKGAPTYTDDMQKIPEQHRAKAVMVSGVAVDEQDEAERARSEAEERARQERAERQVKAPEPFSARLVRSGIAFGIFLAVLFVISNIDALREQAHVLYRIRTSLVLLLLVFLGVTHAQDVAGLLGKVGETVSSPVASIQESSAERGKKAADAYRSTDSVLDQKAREEEERFRQIDRKFEAAERGR